MGDTSCPPRSLCGLGLLIGMHRSKVKSIRAAAVALLLLLAITGCDGPAKQVIGRWQSVDTANPMIWEFSRNGSVTVGSEPGRYSFGDGNRIKIQTRIATFVYTVGFAEDRMIWTEPSGSKTEFQRAR